MFVFKRWWFQIFLIFTPILGEDEPILPKIFPASHLSLPEGTYDTYTNDSLSHVGPVDVIMAPGSSREDDETFIATPPENGRMSTLKRDHFRKNISSSNHHFSRDMVNFGGVYLTHAC